MKKGNRNQQKNLGGSIEEQKLVAANKTLINQIMETNRQYLEIYQDSRKFKDDKVSEKDTWIESLEKENKRLYHVLRKALDNLNHLHSNTNKGIDAEEGEEKSVDHEDEPKVAGDEEAKILRVDEEKGQDLLNFIIPRRRRTPRFPVLPWFLVCVDPLSLFFLVFVTFSVVFFLNCTSG